MEVTPLVKGSSSPCSDIIFCNHILRVLIYFISVMLIAILLARFGSELSSDQRLEAEYSPCVLWRTDSDGVTLPRENGTLFIFDGALGFDSGNDGSRNNNMLDLASNGDKHVLQLRDVVAVHKQAALVLLHSNSNAFSFLKFNLYSIFITLLQTFVFIEFQLISVQLNIPIFLVGSR